jgi:hypothetical protein
MGELEKASGLQGRLKEEIEQFFLSATFFTGKDPQIRVARAKRGDEAHRERTA